MFFMYNYMVTMPQLTSIVKWTWRKRLKDGEESEGGSKWCNTRKQILLYHFTPYSYQTGRLSSSDVDCCWNPWSFVYCFTRVFGWLVAISTHFLQLLILFIILTFCYLIIYYNDIFVFSICVLHLCSPFVFSICVLHLCSPFLFSICVLHLCSPFFTINSLNPEWNPICYLLALLAYHFLHVSRIRVKSLTIRLLMSYIYGAPILDVSRSHTTTQHSR